jgi:heterodisulfide reductase subunit C
MHVIQQILFILLVLFSVGFFAKKVRQIRRNMNLGREENLTDHPGKRWRNVLLLALGQRKMFRNPLVAVMHFVIYAGFIIINIEVLEIVLDGMLGTHRLFVQPLGSSYFFLINSFEFLAVGVITVCVIFLARRNIIKLKRFISHDLDGWPRSDANYILIFEIILMTLFLTMNASDRALQLKGHEHYTNIGSFWFSGIFAQGLSQLPGTTLASLERGAWWMHITGIFIFLNYLPWSKHLHIIMAFPNAYYLRLVPQGKMINMPEVEKEVLYAMQPESIPATSEAGTPKKFGAKDIFDLSWKNLMDAYSCTECGRCSAACPATQTGKLLSPRKIMMDTRDRMEEVGKILNKKKQFEDDGKSLLHEYISVEELRACTSCQACVQECPVGISPLDIILQLRRYLVMEESNAPPEWNAMFSNVENNFAPWKFSPDDRDKWALELETGHS